MLSINNAHGSASTQQGISNQSQQLREEDAEYKKPLSLTDIPNISNNQENIASISSLESLKQPSENNVLNNEDDYLNSLYFLKTVVDGNIKYHDVIKEMCDQINMQKKHIAELEKELEVQKANHEAALESEKHKYSKLQVERNHILRTLGEAREERAFLISKFPKLD